MTQEVQDLIDQVANTKGVEASAVALIQAYAAKFAAIADNPAAVRQAASELKDSADAMAAAVAANPVS